MRGAALRPLTLLGHIQDAINRRVATETLLEAAYEAPRRQHIFLTPQDIQASGMGQNGVAV